MKHQKDPNAKEGMRVKLTGIMDDPNPIPKGSEGTIVLIDDAGILHVKWDNGRRLGLIPDVDPYILEPDLENIFDKITEGDFGPDVKKIANAGKQPLPKIDTKPPSNISGSLKKIGVKPNQVSKNARNAGIKEEEKDLEEMTGAGGAATGAPSSSGAYIGPAGATKPTFGVGPLTSTGVAKPGPLHPKKKRKKKVKENIFTKTDLINEITDSWEVDWFDDTNREPWADKNNDGWRWNDTTIFKDGVIVDPLAKMKTAWDDENLDISKEWDKHQKLKKEDILKMVKNRINESKEVIKEKWSEKYKKSIDCKNPKGFSQKAHCQGRKKVKEEEQQIEEETTFSSVFGTGFPNVPAFAAKKGQWRTAKKPIWVGGKIVQQVENSGVLNPVNEANTVKYNPKGKIVKVKKKCTKFPYCSQGAIDNPLNISDKVTEPGTYVEQFYKNIHEVALETGKSFDEVYKIVKSNLNN